MTKFVVIKKESLDKSIVNATHIVLNDATILHTKMALEDVAEFIRQGDHLILKLKNGETILIENFFIVFDDEKSDLVFEDDECVLYWFDGQSGFTDIPGLEVLLTEPSQFSKLVPWLIGAGVLGGLGIALGSGGGKSKPGTITVEVNTQGEITGTTTKVKPGETVYLTINGQDEFGEPLQQVIETQVNEDGSYSAQVPTEFADGDLDVQADSTDQKGRPLSANDNLGSGTTDRTETPQDESKGLDRVEGSITVDVNPQGEITGTTTDVEPSETVVLTITGQDVNGEPLTATVETTVNADGSYDALVPEQFADGELTVKADTTDRNGTAIEDTDELPEGTDGLDRVEGTITVEVDAEGTITGTTTDVEPGETVVLTITGQDVNGEPLTATVETTVNADGSYDALVPEQFADGELTVKADTTDRNGTAIEDTDELPEGTDGLDRVEGSITVDVNPQGEITGTTTDVEPGETVVLTITGQDVNGAPLTATVETTVNPDGSYDALVPTEFADGELTVKAETTDRNGTAIEDTDELPEGTDGLDRVEGTITVEVDAEGTITGTTTDVEPGKKVTLTVTGKNAAGEEVTEVVETTVNTDGSYIAFVPAQFVDGDLTVQADTNDRNGKAINDTDALGATVTDDPATPKDESKGLDRVEGTITVDVNPQGQIVGKTTDVQVGETVILTINGFDAAGEPIEVVVETQVQADGRYNAVVPEQFADGDLTVKADTIDRNGNAIDDTDALGTTATDDPATPKDESNGLDRVEGTIKVTVDSHGIITGNTTDVKSGEIVILTIVGQDKQGNPISEIVETTVDDNGRYTALVPEQFADGDLTVNAQTVDRNGTSIEDQDQLTASDDTTGLDREPGTIDVDVNTQGQITGQTTKVPQGNFVTLTITGHDANGEPVTQTITTIVLEDGSYQTSVPAIFADGDLVVVATAIDRNDHSLQDEDALGVTAQDDSSTSEDESRGLDRDPSQIEVDVTTQGQISGQTKDVEPGETVILTITGQDLEGNELTTEVTTTVNPDGSYNAIVPEEFADGDLVVVATTTDRNQYPIQAEDRLGSTATDDPNTRQDETIGLDRTQGEITVDINTQGLITGQTDKVTPGETIVLTVTGQDKYGEPLTVIVYTTASEDGSYIAQVPADIVDGDVQVTATTVDRNGYDLAADDEVGSTVNDDPNTPADENAGLDRTPGTITVEVETDGTITGTTTDVAPGTEVIITVTGQDKDGNPIERQVMTQVDENGDYNAEVPEDFADGKLTVTGETIDRNGNPLQAEDGLEKTDTDNDPSTPDQGGLDRTPGTITVEVETDGMISGTTTDVAPGTEVIITVTGQDKDGNPIERQVTTQVDENGDYTAEIPEEFADGKVTVTGETIDRNGNPLQAEDGLEKTDTDNDPSTPDQGGLDRTPGTITVEVETDGTITGTTTDVAPGTEVIITVTGQDKDGNPIERQVTTQVDENGDYTAEVPEEFADGKVTVTGETVDRNGSPLQAEDGLEKTDTDTDNDPSTPDQGGLDRTPGTIDVTVDKKGNITGTTTDVEPNEKVVLTLVGADVNGNSVTTTIETTVNPDGSYVAKVPDQFTGGDLIVTANTTDRNGQQLTDDANVKLAKLVDDVSAQMQEDGSETTGRLFTTGQSLKVTAVSIDGKAYNLGESITLANVGTVKVTADGQYSFKPVADYSGEVPLIDYVVSNGQLSQQSQLGIDVIAVADKPTTGNFKLDPQSSSLNIQTWTGVKKVAGYNLLENKGDGASKNSLLNGIDYLRTHSNVKNDDGSSITASSVTTTTSLSSDNLQTYKAVYISGFVFLEVGQTYQYLGSGDDSAAIVIGDNVSSLHVNWKGTSTSGSGDFSVTQTGYYSFQFYAHNADDVGKYNFSVQNADGTTAMKYYPNVEAIKNSLKGTSYLLNDYDAGTDGKADTGFYAVSRGYEGPSQDVIPLTGILLETADVDGSEYLSFMVKGLPAGSTLEFKDAAGQVHQVTVESDGLAKFMPDNQDTASQYSDFKLIVSDNSVAKLNVELTVTAIEKSNGDSHDAMLEFEVAITNAQPQVAPAMMLFSFEDDVIGLDSLDFEQDEPVDLFTGSAVEDILIDAEVNADLDDVVTAYAGTAAQTSSVSQVNMYNVNATPTHVDLYDILLQDSTLIG